MLARATALALLVTACAGARSAGAPGGGVMAAESIEGQSLAAALARVCAAPTRAEADPQYGDAAARISVLSQHLSDGITNPEVMAAIERWRSDQVTSEQRSTELAELLDSSGLITPCRLADVWASPDWGTSEL